MKRRSPSKARKRGRPRKRGGADPQIGVRLGPAMRDALDEMALEWQVTRSFLVRELIAHALKGPPERPKKT